MHLLNCVSLSYYDLCDKLWKKKTITDENYGYFYVIIQVTKDLTTGYNR